jgi:hypothetical protein
MLSKHTQVPAKGGDSVVLVPLDDTLPVGWTVVGAAVTDGSVSTQYPLPEQLRSQDTRMLQFAPANPYTQ